MSIFMIHFAEMLYKRNILFLFIYVINCERLKSFIFQQSTTVVLCWGTESPCCCSNSYTRVLTSLYCTEWIQQKENPVSSCANKLNHPTSVKCQKSNRTSHLYTEWWESYFYNVTALLYFPYW
jgi:hypothetical protein